MSMLDLFWIVLLFLALQPFLRRKLLEFSRKRAIARLERAHGSRLILLVHRQESMALLGLPVFRYIDINDAESVLRAIHMTDRTMPLELVLHTPGGLVLSTTQIARALQRHEGPVTVYVPHLAMSGGTLIALAADRIVMSPSAVLGPVDPQLARYPAASVRSVLERKPVERIDDQTLILADQGAKALAQMEQTVRGLIGERMPPDQRERLVELLTSGVWTHDYPLDYDAARELGLPVSDEIPEPVLELMRLYPQPVRSVPTVEYVPLPRKREDKRDGDGGDGR